MLAGWALGTGVRRVSVRTGVSDEEALGSLPGDEFIAHPMVEWTRGVTVHAAPERVWPWLAQMKYGRGGWYTPQWVDLFANRWVFGIQRRFPASADRLLPQYQHVAVGDLICDGPGYASYFRSCASIRSMPWSIVRSATCGVAALSTSPTRSRRSEPSSNCARPAPISTSRGRWC